MKKTSIILGLMLLISFAFSIPKPTIREIQTEIDAMIVATTMNFSYDILSVSNPAKNFVAVAINPPYREFPNIILFTYADNKWQRVFEGLSVGIQDARSGFIDLHTLGLCADFTVGKQTEYSFQDDIVKKMLGKDSIIIPYKNFLHMHLAGKSPYVIDKTGLYDIANQLSDDAYTQYPTTNCMMYDLPKITTANLTEVQGAYTVTAQTDNDQYWQITFEGVEDNGLYLKNKKVTAKKQ